MSDRTRLVTVGAGGQLTTVRDYEVPGTYEKVRGSFKWTAPPVKAVDSARDQRFAGSRTVAESHDNGAIAWTAMVSGGTPDTCLANAGRIMSDLRYAGSIPRFVEFRAESSTYSTLFEIRGSATVQLNYGWAQFVGAGSMPVDVSVPVGPLPRGLPMDITDDYSTDTIGDYALDAGAGTIAVGGGQLVPSSTAIKRLRHTARGYTYGDCQPTLKITPSTAANQTVSVKLATGANDYLRFGFVAGVLDISIVVAGTPTSLVSNFPTTTAPPAGAPFWIRGRREGNTLTVTYWTAAPTPMGTAAITVTHTLSTANAAIAGAGIEGTAGFDWTPVSTNDRVDDFAVLPYTYVNRILPEEVALRGVIPGDAPALADITVTIAGAAGVPTWALFGWTDRPTQYSYVWNGDFEETGTDGWSVAIVTGVQAVAGTSINRDTTAARTKYGSANGVIVTPASSGAGASFAIYRRFKKGVTYTVALWASAASSVTGMVAKLGVSGDVATSSAAALTTTPTLYTTTWTPTADRNTAYLSMQTNAATATTFNIDGAAVYEGAVAPSLGRQGEGAGGVPPFGILAAAACDPGDLTGWALTADAGARVGFWLYDAAVAGAETYTAGWLIDPNLLLADDFTLGELDVEVWARVLIDTLTVTPRATLSARPESGTGYGSERFTAEWQNTGRLLTVPTTAARYRRTRLGTLTFPVDPSNPARWKLWLTMSTGIGSTGTLGCDFLTLAPTRYRCSSPSGKANDATYPVFVTTSAETSKTIRSDLRGLVAKPPLAPTADRGLGGAPIELPAGNADVLIDLSSVVPDDPTVNAAQETNAMPATIHVGVWPRSHGFRSS